MNSLYMPKSAVEYFQSEFKNQFEIVELETSDNTVKLVFNREIHEADVINIFFTGAKWGINYINKTN